MKSVEVDLWQTNSGKTFCCRARHYKRCVGTAVPLSLVCWDAVAAVAGGEAAPVASCRTPVNVAVDRDRFSLHVCRRVQKKSLFFIDSGSLRT